MNTFLADLHIHSRFSRATSSRLTAPHLAAWGAVKGLSVIATGDFTHPQWRDELRAALVQDEASGLYRLRRPANVAGETGGPDTPPGAPEPLFLLEAEISSIYKKHGAVHKVHNLVYLPDFASADRLCRKLEQIGNLASDGRPILGLDSERLLEMVLDTDPRGVLIPAHIWTPWFSLFGSRSGFDSIAECFGALSPQIFAMETGLSSDPDMNRLWSELDRIVMVSNSDAHSGENLGREATVFAGAPSYDGLFGALRRAAAQGPEQTARQVAAARNGGLPAADHAEGTDSPACVYAGTLEFFPEEGKYHLDGHRVCNVVLEPEETRRLGSRCPVCGRELTVGVLNRVTGLADRKTPRPAPGTGFTSLIPLPELVGELLGVGSKSGKVRARYAELLRVFGPELDILCQVSEADLRQEWADLGEAVARMRAGRVIRQGGYDGEYGVVRVFAPQERGLLGGRGGRRQVSLLGDAGQSAPNNGRQTSLAATELLTDVAAPAACPPDTAPAAAGPGAACAGHVDTAQPAGDTGPARTAAETPGVIRWSAAQQAALRAGPHPVLVLAGPGAGKTRTLIGRVDFLLGARGVPPEQVAAVTFTRRAAGEVRERLAAAGLPVSLAADTLHALALTFWPGAAPAVLSEEGARAAFAAANAGAEFGPAAGSHPDKNGQRALRAAFDALNLCRETLAAPSAEQSLALARYTDWKRARQLADYTDLLETWLARLQSGACARPWTQLLVDEAQDLSPLQLALIRALLPPDGAGFFGIGDPDQAIYGFRGALSDIQTALAGLWPGLETVTLNESYRSGAAVLHTASSLLGAASRCGSLRAARPLETRLRMFAAPDAEREAAWIASEAAELLGSTSHTLQDARKTRDNPLAGRCSPADIAVLVRVKALFPPLLAALERRGIPCAGPEAEAFWEEPRVALLLALAAQRCGRPAACPLPVLEVPDAAWDNGPRAVLEALEKTPPFDELVQASKAFHALETLWRAQGGWAAMLDWLTGRQELDLAREAGERVRVLTLHAAKGLEFRAVFLPALEEGLLPFAGPASLAGGGADGAELPAAALAEERRLLYVGLTRASEAVYISRAESRRLYGAQTRHAPSRFLADLPELFVRTHLVRHAATEKTQLSLL